MSRSSTGATDDASSKITQAGFDINNPSFEKGNYKPTDKPSEIAKGVWKNRKNRLTADEIRTKAWQRNQ